jgi:hypothetical protein
VVHRQASFGHQFLQIPETQGEPAIPSHAGHNDDAFKLTLAKQRWPTRLHAINLPNQQMQHFPQLRSGPGARQKRGFLPLRDPAMIRPEHMRKGRSLAARPGPKEHTLSNRPSQMRLLLLVEKGSEICFECRAFEELIPKKASDTRGIFPGSAADRMNEDETGMQSVGAVVRDGLSDLERTLINVLNWYYLVHKSDPQGFGRIEDLPRDRHRDRTPLTDGRRNCVKEYEGPEAYLDSGDAEGCVFGRYHYVAVGHHARATSQRGPLHCSNQRLREAGSHREQCFLNAADAFHVSGGEFVEVHPPAKGLALTCEQYRTDAWIFFTSVNHVHQFSAEFSGKRIALTGAVEPQTQDSALLLRFQDATHPELIV